jgi:hypothetical protein
MAGSRQKEARTSQPLSYVTLVTVLEDQLPQVPHDSAGRIPAGARELIIWTGSGTDDAYLFGGKAGIIPDLCGGKGGIIPGVN